LGQQQQADQQPAEPATPSTSTNQGLSLSDQVIQQILEPLRNGMVTQNIQMVLSVFDKKELDSYTDLQGQLQAFFQTYDEVRFRYQIMQVTGDQGTGSMTAMVEMDALPYGASQVPTRRSVQMRFQIRLKGEKWKVTSFRPADFFGLGYNRTDVR
jgi:6-phosphogluconate dehydrogenase